MNQDKSRVVRQSILDRLISRDDARESHTWEESVEEMKVNLLRDLEWLLNTRETGDPARPPLVELEQSIYNYGLPDFASMSADSSTTPGRLLRDIEREIRLFEPRLAQVEVEAVEKEEGGKQKLQFIIKATLRLDPDPERVEFDSVLEISSGKVSLST